jgi:hypothetical protein
VLLLASFLNTLYKYLRWGFIFHEFGSVCSARRK